MKQRFLLPEKSARFEASASLSQETGLDREPPLHASVPVRQDNRAEVLGLQLSQLVDQNQKRAGRAAWFAPVFLSLTTLSVLIISLLLGGDAGEALIASPMFYLWTVMVLISCLGLLFRSDTGLHEQSKQISQALARLDDIRTVGPLIDTLKMDYRDIHRVSTNALIKLLPRLQANDADLLTAEQRAVLCRKLSRIPIRAARDERDLSQDAYTRAISLRIAILQAFAQVGDSGALPIVEWLAQIEAMTEDERRIQEAAQACLPTLRLRVEQEQNDQTLLRAADVSGADAKTLLRTFEGSQETVPEQLLRPGPPPL